MRASLPLVLALALTVAATADSSAGMSASDTATQWFQVHDRNGDGYLTADEVIVYEAKLAKRMDKDGNGKLSVEEYIAGIPADQIDLVERYRRRFKTMDADGDAFVTEEELTVFYRFVLKTADTNGDDHVSLQEWLGATEGE